MSLIHESITALTLTAVRDEKDKYIGVFLAEVNEWEAAILKRWITSDSLQIVTTDGNQHLLTDVTVLAESGVVVFDSMDCVRVRFKCDTLRKFPAALVMWDKR